MQAAEESNVSAELIAQRKRLVDEWNAWRIRAKEDLAADRGRSGKKTTRKEDKAKEEAKEESGGRCGRYLLCFCVVCSTGGSRAVGRTEF